MVICVCSCEIFDPDRKGKYRGGQDYPWDDLADRYPNLFKRPEAPKEAATDKKKRGEQ